MMGGPQTCIVAMITVWLTIITAHYLYFSIRPLEFAHECHQADQGPLHSGHRHFRPARSLHGPLGSSTSSRAVNTNMDGMTATRYKRSRKSPRRKVSYRLILRCLLYLGDDHIWVWITMASPRITNVFTSPISRLSSPGEQTVEPPGVSFLR